jgi:serine phosphatase RsbU (regulator of sigma subunit)/anti-sigma regulatory factor (Ser/Thr protein kinase)
MVVRRIRLPADRRTPAAARALVRSVLSEADLTGLLDEALLLTTELSTNGVLHAGTDIDLEVVADDGELTVTVIDYSTGTPAVATSRAQGGLDVPERGRGLFLVDHFATAWGVTHHASGKGVWFRLGGKPTDTVNPSPRLVPHQVPGPDRRATNERGTGGRAGRPAPPAEALSASALAGLAAVELHSGDTSATGPTSPIGKLLSRLCGAVGATAGVVVLDRADGNGRMPVAEYGLRVPRDAGEIRIPLAVSRPWSGELALATPKAANGYVRPLAELTAERLSLALENDRLRRTDLRRQAWLTFLAEASELLAQCLEVELTMALIPRLIVPRLGQWCAVYTTDEWSEPQLASAAHTDEGILPELLAGLSVSGPEGPVARLREVVRTGQQAPMPPPVDGYALPLAARGQRLGALAVGRHSDHRQDPQELAVLEDVARRAALAIDNARIHAERRRIAETLQQSLLPPALPAVAGIAFGAEYVPTLGDADVGGDFYDVVPMPDGRWLVVVGDVSGKGVQAAAVTGLVRDVIRVLIRDGRSLPEVLRRINETLVERGGGRYCTLAMAAVGIGDEHRLEINLHLAGHDRPVLVATDGEARFVGSPGTALGLLEQVKTPSVSVPLGPGDTLVFYTDGVTERRRGDELFGLDRLRAAVGPLAGYAADVVAARLRAATLGFSTEPPRDDIAILTLRNDFTPEPARVARP